MSWRRYHRSGLTRARWPSLALEVCAFGGGYLVAREFADPFASYIVGWTFAWSAAAITKPWEHAWRRHHRS